MSNDIREQILDVMAKSASIDRSRITMDSTLKDLNVDSIDAMQIIFDLEDHFSITVPDRDPNFDTASVGGLINAVEQMLATKDSTAAVRPATA